MDLMVTYLEMTAPPSSLPQPLPAVQVTTAREILANDDYLALYSAIGAALQWDSRLRMPQDALAELLSQSSTHLHVLRQNDVAIGLAEFVEVGTPDVELVHFGLVSTAHGRGLGKFFLDQALRAIWLHAPARLWLHTDTNDSPAAIPLYTKAGFQPYLTQMETFPD
ncbi:GNAT family N-acetyltransferase [Mesorhizobium sp. CAU 1732]|uniref:GNAT family N-acetyltransferase n=1 Tax=Mesorhizobium sp. CAU 1732 TaxID=3140358 RepID=UPI003260AC1D